VSRQPLIAAAIAAGLVAGVLAGGALADPPTRNFAFKAQKNDYAPAPGGQNYSACWSYIHSDGREYAAIGVNGLTASTGGTAIYNVTNPAAPYLVAFIPGPQSIWREMKSYRDWLYVVTEASGSGLQIIRMTNPEAPVLAATYATNFNRSHTVAVDTTRGLLVCNGTRNVLGEWTGMRILALNNSGIGATPETPVELSWWPGVMPVQNPEYVHDSAPIGNRLYAACIYSGIERIFDITNPAAPAQINSWTYPGGFTHNSWPDATGHWLYVTDEVNGEPLKIFDISNPMAPAMANTITSNPQAIVHNAHVKGNILFLANYTEGIRALDLSDPRHPAEFAWADSYAGPSGGFGGVWEVGPYFPSGTVIASDRNSGLYVYRLETNYGILRAKVTDQADNPFAGVEVHVETLGDSLTTPADGIVQFAPGPGSHTVLAHKFGYEEASATRTVSVGSRDTVTLQLLPKPTVLFTGIVRDQATSNPLDDAEVSLAYTGIHQHTGAGGLYALDIPDDIYRLEVRRAGHLPLVMVRRIGPGFPGQDFSLPPAPVWDPLEVAGSWTVGAVGDNATGGVWTRVVPQGTGPRPPYTPPPGPATLAGAGRAVLPGPGAPALPGSSLASRFGRMNPELRGLLGEMASSQPAASAWHGDRVASPMHEEEPAVVNPNLAPYFDHTPGTGTMCFVTGNSADSVNIQLADVDNGKTTLTTPALDLTGMAEPTIGYWRWFASFLPIGTSVGHNGPDSADYLATLISNDNGVTWTVVDTTRGMENLWTEASIAVADYVTPTATVKLRFVAADLGTDSGVEAGIDDLVAYDAANIPNVSSPPPAGAARLAFRAPWPNPARGAVRLMLDVPAAGQASVDVLDLAGRRVQTLHRGATAAGPLALAWDGRDASGREAPAGLYFARATAGAERALTRFVRIR
jgi:choice-of-anchor B domain-containing protein